MSPRFTDAIAFPAHRFALGHDASGTPYLSIPVSNRLVDYCEYYRIDAAAFERYRTNPAAAEGFLERVRNREADELLILKPGTDRGVPS